MIDFTSYAKKKERVPRVIAVDFDGTLCKNRYPDIGEPNKKLFSSLIQNQKDGDTIILWSSREGTELEQALYFCHQQGLDFDSVCGGKLSANIYIDDKAVKPYW